MADPDATLERLIALWRAHKDPELAELVARFAEANESSVGKALRTKPKLSVRDWLAALADASLVDRGAVLVSLATATSGQVAERIRALAELDPDPRIVDALHRLIETMPWTSTGARKVWTRAFALLAEVADPRTIAVARGFDPKAIPNFPEFGGVWLVERLARLADAVADQVQAPAPALDPEAVGFVESAAAGLQTGPPELGVLTELFEASMREPDDLDARLVLADALMDVGDPRGELIRVQVARESAPDDKRLRARENKLLAEHRDALLGPLEPVVRKGTLEFERGFVSACTIDVTAHAKVRAEALADPQLATVRRLRGPLEFVLAPHLRRLREVSVIHEPGSAPSLAPLFRSERTLAFEAVEAPFEPADVALLDGCACLPHLRRLGIAGGFTEQRRAMARALARVATEIHFEGPDLERVDALLAAALARNDLAGRVSCSLEVAWETWSGSLALDRAGDGTIEARMGVAALPKQRHAIDRVIVGIQAAVRAIQLFEIRRLEVHATKPIGDQATRNQVRAAVAVANTTIPRVEFVGWDRIARAGAHD